MQDVEPALDHPWTRELPAPDQRADRAAEQRDRQRDRVGDGQAHPAEQVVGQRVAGEALEHARGQQPDAQQPRELARAPVGGGEEHAQEVHDHRGDEDERGPVVGLAHEQPAGDRRGEVERRAEGARHLRPLQRVERAVVDDRAADVGREEEREVDAGRHEDEEGVQRDLAQHERPVVGEDVAQRLARHAPGPQAPVDGRDDVGLALEAAHRFTLHHAGPTEPESGPAATSVPSGATASGSCASGRAAGPKTGLAAWRTSKVE